MRDGARQADESAVASLRGVIQGRARPRRRPGGISGPSIQCEHAHACFAWRTRPSVLRFANILSDASLCEHPRGASYRTRKSGIGTSRPLLWMGTIVPSTSRVLAASRKSARSGVVESEGASRAAIAVAGRGASHQLRDRGGQRISRARNSQGVRLICLCAFWCGTSPPRSRRRR